MKAIGAAIWREWESGSSLAVRLLRIAVLFIGLLFLCFTATLGLPWPEQAALAALTVIAAVWLDRSSSSYLVTLTLMLVSVYSTFRYGFWRLATTVDFFRGPASPHRLIEFLVTLCVLFSECYGFVALLLGYMQMLWPLRRTPVPLSEDTSEWPAVDVLIPTLNEPLEIVRFTALAAVNMDWPADRLNVYILDDGRRNEFRAFAEEAGLGYMTRSDGRGAKAGNINAALEKLDSQFVAVFDSDHVPTRSFLQVAMGWFLRDERLGILQTPHHFYSPDPFERNLRQFRTIPNEDELFHALVQDGNDFWNAAAFCGSCAVLRRKALDEAGGMATETVTEDAHTSLRMQRLGWNSAYINIPQAAGLASERLSDHVRQRVRWACGMVQILRVENPLLAKGLTVAQRLCYFHSMAQFLYALPRLIFLSAPLLYLVFGYSPIPGEWAAILAYAAPYLLLANVTRSRMQGAHRHAFWTEIYQTVLAPHLLLPTLAALLVPTSASSHVAMKGAVGEKGFFDRRIALPTLLLLSLNWFGLCCTLPRLVQLPMWHVPVWAGFMNWPATLYNPTHRGMALLYAGWTLFNLVLLGVAAAVAWESPQRRKAVRVDTELDSEIMLPDGSSVRGITSDVSSGGLRATLEYDVALESGDTVQFLLPVLDSSAVLPATVVSVRDRVLRARFEHLNMEQLESLTLLLYSRADRWLGWDEAREPDRPVRSLLHVLRVAVHGFVQTVLGTQRREIRRPPSGFASVVPLLTLALFIGAGERTAGGQPHSMQSPGTFHSNVTLADATVDGPLVAGTGFPRIVSFGIGQNELVKKASIHLMYRVPVEQPGYRLQVSLNGSSVATLDSSGVSSAGSQHRPEHDGEFLRVDIPLAPELLVRANQLAFQLTAPAATPCGGSQPPTAIIGSDSTIDIAGTLIPLEDELGVLPVPFYQPGLTSTPLVRIAFLGHPTREAEQAAGIVASWLGTAANRTPLKFAVSIGAIPKGNVVALAESSADLPGSLNLATVPASTVGIRTNPEDPYGKVLILTGNGPQDLVKDARFLAAQHGPLSGSEVTVPNLPRASPREPDDAPRWVSTSPSADLRFAAVADTLNLATDGLQPAQVTLRLPPSLYFGKDADGQARREIPLHLSYQYDGPAVVPGSTLEIDVNGERIAAAPLPVTGQTRTVIRNAVFSVPISALRAFSNTFQFRLSLQHAPGAICSGRPESTSSISNDSWLDVRGVPHWAELPDLALFSHAGYPFTRHADLTGTAVVLPEHPEPGELELFLGVMARWGGLTGYPALNLSVASPAEMVPNRGLDYLVLGTVEDSSLPPGITADLPVNVSRGHLETEAQPVASGFKLPWRTAKESDLAGALARQSIAPDALIEEVRWPRGSQHSAVLLLARDEVAVPDLITALLSPAQNSRIAGGVSVLRQGTFVSYPASGEHYMLGRTTPLMWLVNEMSRLPWLVAGLSVLFCFLIASVLRTALRRAARMRLQGSC